MESLSGDASAAKIAEIVDGKSIAVDLSVWMCQAENMGNSAYASQVSSETRVMKLVFERVRTDEAASATTTARPGLRPVSSPRVTWLL